MDSALEQQRLYHEELERLHKACVDELSHISKSVSGTPRLETA